MKILFATTNPAKVAAYKEKLNKNGIELITLKDLDCDLEVEESGKNAIENAYIKAKAYSDATGMITIGMDNNLFIEGIPEEKQPGTHVRRVNGKTLTDEEMIIHYTNLVKQYGGKLIGKWVYGMAICNGEKTEEYTWSKGEFCLVDTPTEKRNPGYPLDSITIMPEFNKYLVNMTKEEKGQRKGYNSDDVVDFITKTVKNWEE